VRTRQGDDAASLAAIALLRDLPENGLVRGQVGTVVEPLDEATALVEFDDDQGVAYAIVPCSRDALLVPRTAPPADCPAEIMDNFLAKRELRGITLAPADRAEASVGAER
jgi:hypothetical protein